MLCSSESVARVAELAAAGARRTAGIGPGRVLVRLEGLTLGCLEPKLRVEGAGGGFRGCVGVALTVIMPTMSDDTKKIQHRDH